VQPDVRDIHVSPIIDAAPTTKSPQPRKVAPVVLNR
jgi:hypothetical protein